MLRVINNKNMKLNFFKFWGIDSVYSMAPPISGYKKVSIVGVYTKS